MSTRHGLTLTLAVVLLIVLSGCIGASPATTDTTSTTTTTTTTTVDTTTTTTTTTESTESDSVSTDTMTTTIADTWENASTIEPGTIHDGEADSRKFFFETTSNATVVVTIDDMANNSNVAIGWTQQDDGPEIELIQEPGTYEFDLEPAGPWGLLVESRGEGPLVNVTVTLESQ